jgi:bifunctional UDP-N-acetylglucosamine pyrophosphorylase/glucosamine-1-phosphate N-acetyltransferase/UDP-N-acetylglucosamine pyrophosphorylase
MTDSTSTEVTAIVLAAGKGTRMKSDLPKVLFPVLGRPMIHWVLDALEAAGISKKVIVVGYRSDLVEAELCGRDGVHFAIQSQQLGTGHAVQMCTEAIKKATGPIMIVAGDSPLLQSSSILELIEIFQANKPSCLLGTLLKDNPQGLGRIVRNGAGDFEKIVEQKDATSQQQQIREVNMSTYLFDREDLLWSLGRLTNENAQAEYYLTDCPQKILEAGKLVIAKPVLKPCEALSINTVDELGAVESKMLELGYRCES